MMHGCLENIVGPIDSGDALGGPTYNILYWNGQLVWTALGLYTGMDNYSLDTSSRTLFVREDVRMSTSRRT